MTACNQQIVTAYEELEMTPEEIAAEQDFELMAVKSILMQFSSAYRKAVKANDEDGFSEEEAKMAHDVIVTAARYSEDERLKVKSAMYIRDDKKGRLDVAKQIAGLQFNAFMFNEQLRKAQAAKNRAKGSITVNTEVVKELANE